MSINKTCFILILVERPRIIKEKGLWKLSRLVKQNRCPTAGQLTAQYDAGSSSGFSEFTAQRTLLDMGLHSRRPTRGSLFTKSHC
ncbi:HTH_Tnp_Tc3_2 domain-containing protein [Trichonephila clavipes]|nr:HTH_Tnp_Tc3_2 domain-containing protein [Trichonephila clavipes]